jgi:murein DD-endopeptidase MepM/ murein hydrolase activator NlpD
VDIFAPEGTPIVANMSGTIEIANHAPIGGNRIWIRGDDGRGYYYAHLAGFAEGIEAGMHVGAGQTIGYVGSTGDAQGKSPHLHFAISRDNCKPGDSDDPAAAGWLDPGSFLGIAPASAR